MKERLPPFKVEFESFIKINEAGSANYERLNNKPSINNTTLIGNKSLEDIGISSITNIELEEIFKI